MPPRKASPAKVVPSSGNSLADGDFIREHSRELRIFEGQLVWSGMTVDFGSPYQLPPPDHRCTHATTVRDSEGNAVLNAELAELKRQCPKWALRAAFHPRRGPTTSLFCIEHSGGSSAIQNAVREMLLSASPAIAGALIAEATNPDASPADRIKALNSVLDRAGIKVGVEVSPDVPAWQQLFRSWTEGGYVDAGTEGSPGGP